VNFIDLFIAAILQVTLSNATPAKTPASATSNLNTSISVGNYIYNATVMVLKTHEENIDGLSQSHQRDEVFTREDPARCRTARWTSTCPSRCTLQCVAAARVGPACHPVRAGGRHGEYQHASWRTTEREREHISAIEHEHEVEGENVRCERHSSDRTHRRRTQWSRPCRCTWLSGAVHPGARP
jgi:hypothetical protein